MTAIDIEAPGASASALRAALQPLKLIQTGALAYVGSDLTTQNFSGAGTTFAINSEIYDAVAIHDNVTNNHRMTVPTGYGFARFTYGLYFTLGTAGDQIGGHVQRMTSSSVLQDFKGLPLHYSRYDSAGECALNTTSAIIPVSAGDYFRVLVFSADASVTVKANLTWVALELWPS